MNSVSIIGLGKSCVSYVGDLFKALREGRDRVTDEVWTINHGGYFFKEIDLIIAMDDMRWKAKEYGRYIEHLHRQSIPILTAVAYPEYPNAIKFPDEAFEYAYEDKQGFSFMNNSCAYAIAYALYRGAKEIRLYGYDFTTYPDIVKVNDDDPEWRRFHLPENLPMIGEPGETCVAYMIGKAEGLGTRVYIPSTSRLFDRDLPPYLYGYVA